MSARLKPPHPPPSPEERLFLAVLKTADALGQEAELLTKSIGLTSTQYNVLRILRGAGPDGLPCRGIGERMISRDPDMTRLLDRMEKGGLITRARQKDDRRVVKTQITDAGLSLLQKLDQPMRELHKKQFQHMATAQVKALGDLLDALKNREPD
jgi:MarR family transcriptional regulator, organic hydroperoxide resistance regulator